MSPSSDVFPERLKAARALRGLSQSELAKFAKLQASAVSHFETGARKPSLANIRKLADALNVSTDYLLGRSGEVSGAPTADVLFRDIAKLSADDREVIQQVVAAQLAAKKGGAKDGGDT